jgi:Protein of unknown function (DUF3574)
MRRLLPLLTLSAALVCGAAVAAPQACPAGLRPATTAELFLGRDGAGPGVSEAAWRQFVDSEVAPRFPEGLSVSDVYSQGREFKGPFLHAASKALLIVLTGATVERQSLDLVRLAYEHRFHQQSVMLVEQQACVAF